MEKTAILKNIFQTLLGLITAFGASMGLGLLTILLGHKLDPELLSKWTVSSVLQKSAIILAANSLWLIPVCLFWRRRKYLALGFLLYLVYEISLVGYIIIAVLN